MVHIWMEAIERRAKHFKIDAARPETVIFDRGRKDILLYDGHYRELDLAQHKYIKSGESESGFAELHFQSIGSAAQALARLEDLE